MIEMKSIWTVTTNGARAKIIKNLGSAELKDVMEIDRNPERVGEIEADRAGRTFASMGKSRSSLELHSDPVRKRERFFAEKPAKRLAAERRDGKLDALFVAASPRTLGDLRLAFSPRLLDRTNLAFDKDYTG